MFQRIMAPVDLAHLDKLEKALAVTAGEAKHHGAPVTFVSVTYSGPSSLAHNPEEFKAKLDAFAEAQGKEHGISASAHMVVTPDPTVEVDNALLKAVDECGADLVIMASHQPGVAEYFWPSNGGKVATHTGASILIVRDS